MLQLTMAAVLGGGRSKKFDATTIKRICESSHGYRNLQRESADLFFFSTQTLETGSVITPRRSTPVL